METSKFMVVCGDDGCGAPRPIRHFTDSRRQIFLNSSLALEKEMSCGAFLAVLEKHAPHIVEGNRKSDYCDHCHLWRVTLVPRFWALIDASPAELISIWPQYLEQLDADPLIVAAQSYPAEYGHLFLKYAKASISQNRPALEATKADVLGLLEAGARIYDTGKWHVKLLECRAWPFAMIVAIGRSLLGHRWRHSGDTWHSFSAF